MEVIVDKINEYLSGKPTLKPELLEEAGLIAKYTFERQFMSENKRSGYIGLSGSGKCARQLAYGIHGFPIDGKEVDSRGRITFYQGDLAEAMIYLLAKLSGINWSFGGLNQKSVSLKVGNKEVFGHPDGILDDHLIEVKSMSSYGFSEFEDGNIDESYIYQENAYMESLGLEKCVMVAMNKDNGLLGERIVKKDPEIVKKVYENLSQVFESTKDKLPEPKFKCDEKGFYPWNCLYCGWHNTCLKAEKVLVKGRWKLKEVKNG